MLTTLTSTCDATRNMGETSTRMMANEVARQYINGEEAERNHVTRFYHVSGTAASMWAARVRASSLEMNSAVHIAKDEARTR
jgi:hypothetical protein